MAALAASTLELHRATTSYEAVFRRYGRCALVDLFDLRTVNGTGVSYLAAQPSPGLPDISVVAELSPMMHTRIGPMLQ